MLFGSKESKIEKAVAKKNGDALVKMLNDKDIKVIMQVIEAMGKVGGDACYNALISLLRSPSSDVRVAATSALGVSGDPKAQAHIDHQIARETDEKVKAAMREALSKVHSKD